MESDVYLRVPELLISLWVFYEPMIESTVVFHKYYKQPKTFANLIGENMGLEMNDIKTNVDMSVHYPPTKGKEWFTFPGLYKKLYSNHGPSRLSDPSRIISGRPSTPTIFGKSPYWLTAWSLWSRLYTVRMLGWTVEFEAECKLAKGT